MVSLRRLHHLNVVKRSLLISSLAACEFVAHPWHHAGQLVESIGGGGQRGPDVLVSLFSVFSAAGRLACGAAPEQLLRSHGIPRRAQASLHCTALATVLAFCQISIAGVKCSRHCVGWVRHSSPPAHASIQRACSAALSPVLAALPTRRTAFLVGAAGLTAAAAGLTSLSSLALLWVAAPAAGFAFGCHWSLMPPLASEVLLYLPISPSRFYSRRICIATSVSPSPF